GAALDIAAEMNRLTLSVVGKTLFDADVESQAIEVGEALTGVMDTFWLMMLRAQDEDDGGGMTDVQVRDEAMTIFLAGHETTANALTWLWYLVGGAPEVEAKLHAEIDRVLQGRLPAFGDVGSLPYVERVATEAM